MFQMLPRMERTDGWADEWLSVEAAGTTDGKGAGAADRKGARAVDGKQPEERKQLEQGFP
jgi:hypothetical protein